MTDRAESSALTTLGRSSGWSTSVKSFVAKKMTRLFKFEESVHKISTSGNSEAAADADSSDDEESEQSGGADSEEEEDDEEGDEAEVAEEKDEQPASRKRSKKPLSRKSASLLLLSSSRVCNSSLFYAFDTRLSFFFLRAFCSQARITGRARARSRDRRPLPPKTSTMSSPMAALASARA